MYPRLDRMDRFHETEAKYDQTVAPTVRATILENAFFCPANCPRNGLNGTMSDHRGLSETQQNR